MTHMTHDKISASNSHFLLLKKEICYCTAFECMCLYGKTMLTPGSEVICTRAPMAPELTGTNCTGTKVGTSTHKHALWLAPSVGSTSCRAPVHTSRHHRRHQDAVVRSRVQVGLLLPGWDCSQQASNY